MAKAPDSRLPARERKKYVLDGEKVIFALNQHWLVVLEPVVTCAAVLVLAIVLDTQLPGDARDVANIAWWVWFATILRALYLVWEWRHEWFIATNKRMMRVYGVLDRQVAMMPLGKVTDMRYERTIPGRIFGYGTYIMESAGQVQALSEVHFVPNPSKNYRALVAEMFGIEDEEEIDPDLDHPEGPITEDDLPAVQVEDRYGDLRSWSDEFGDRYADEHAWHGEDGEDDARSPFRRR